MLDGATVVGRHQLQTTMEPINRLSDGFHGDIPPGPLSCLAQLLKGIEGLVAPGVNLPAQLPPDVIVQGVQVGGIGGPSVAGDEGGSLIAQEILCWCGAMGWSGVLGQKSSYSPDRGRRTEGCLWVYLTKTFVIFTFYVWFQKNFAQAEINDAAFKWNHQIENRTKIVATEATVRFFLLQAVYIKLNVLHETISTI